MEVKPNSQIIRYYYWQTYYVGNKLNANDEHFIQNLYAICIFLIKKINFCKQIILLIFSIDY